ncbi:MAG TPA: 6-hydroxynicotinate reductase, partial [Burkholderiales bacterium]|nr:6-hydroxynicotinate reductase [Burkholderiales bacterium]
MSEPAAASSEGRPAAGKIECDACPVLCQISPGRTGACDRWGNFNGKLTRVDPVVLFRKVSAQAGAITGFLEHKDWDGSAIADSPVFVSGV